MIVRRAWLPKSDEELITEVQAGDAAAFDELFARYEPVVRRRLRRIVQSAVAAEDLLQDVFLRVWTKSSTWTRACTGGVCGPT